MQSSTDLQFFYIVLLGIGIGLPMIPFSLYMAHRQASKIQNIENNTNRRGFN